MASTMNALDAIKGACGECYITIDNRRYNFMQALSVEATATKNKVKIPILGKTSKGNKSTSIEYSGKIKYHFNTSVMVKIMEEFKNTGKDLYFDMTLTQNDPNSSSGEYTINLYDCNMDSAILFKFDAESDYVTSEANFTFEDWAIAAEHKLLDGMI